MDTFAASSVRQYFPAPNAQMRSQFSSVHKQDIKPESCYVENKVVPKKKNKVGRIE